MHIGRHAVGRRICPDSDRVEPVKDLSSASDSDLGSRIDLYLYISIAFGYCACSGGLCYCVDLVCQACPYDDVYITEICLDLGSCIYCYIGISDKGVICLYALDFEEPTAYCHRLGSHRCIGIYRGIYANSCIKNTVDHNVRHCIHIVGSVGLFRIHSKSDAYRIGNAGRCLYICHRDVDVLSRLDRRPVLCRCFRAVRGICRQRGVIYRYTADDDSRFDICSCSSLIGCADGNTAAGSDGGPVSICIDRLRCLHCHLFCIFA